MNVKPYVICEKCGTLMFYNSYFKGYHCGLCGNMIIKNKQTNYERVKDMTVEEMAEFLTALIDDDSSFGIGCYRCIDYGTHHWFDGDCNNCSNFPIGLDLKKWLESEVND